MREVCGGKAGQLLRFADRKPPVVQNAYDLSGKTCLQVVGSKAHG